MTELYVFRGTTGRAEMVTDDKSGKKLPSHSFGEWVFSRTINVVTETRLTGGAECGQVLANCYEGWVSSLAGTGIGFPLARERLMLAGWPKPTPRLPSTLPGGT
jgi:hypothetical protein